MKATRKTIEKKKGKTVEIIKSNVINKGRFRYVGGVDKAKQLASSYCCMIKSCKRRKKQFFFPLGG